MIAQSRAVISLLASQRGAPATVIAPTHPDVRYRDRVSARTEIAPLADIYVPLAPNGSSVILVHGGGWVLGSRRMKCMRYLSAKLVEAGVAVCAIDYRLLFRGGLIDEATEDVVDAFAFWSARAATHGLDPRRISLVGLSAGATLSLLAATQLDRVRSIASAFGLYDAPIWKSRMPRHVRQTSAPTLLLHGTRDDLVPVEQAHELAAHRRSLGLPTKLVTYDGAPHGFFSMAIPAAEIATRAIIAHVS
ncbi:MAG TPA: alpha/beta hydrolase [Kofleriaceae bacterium]|nr:alpha/beta hydrolase [Kofleriaceae bacterium]